MAFDLAASDCWLWKWECSDRSPGRACEFTLRLGIPQGRFILKANEADFKNSPDRLTEFYCYFRCLRSRPSGRDPADPDNNGICPNDTVRWILESLLDKLREIECTDAEDPEQEAKATTKPIQECWEQAATVYWVVATQNRLVIKQRQRAADELFADMEQCIGFKFPAEGYGTPPSKKIVFAEQLKVRVSPAGMLPGHETPMSFITRTSMSVLGWQDVEIQGNDPDRPHWVSVRPFLGMTPQQVKDIIRTHNSLNKPVTAHPLFPSGLDGMLKAPGKVFIVARPKCTRRGKRMKFVEALGLVMMHVGTDAMTLGEALARNDNSYTPEQKHRQKKALVKLMACMHKHNLLWGSVGFDSVMVQGDHVWLYHVGPRYSEDVAFNMEQAKLEDRNRLGRMFTDYAYWNMPGPGQGVPVGLPEPEEGDADLEGLSDDDKWWWLNPADESI